jgi:transcriptional regulator GlxA family with amidase domain
MFDRCPLFEISVPLSVFGVDRRSTGAPAYEVLAIAADEGQLLSTGGVRVASNYGLGDLTGAGVVIVPTWRDPAERPPEPVLESLRLAHQEGALVVGLCLGAFVLAAAGLLDGRRAATHWMHAAGLAASYPEVTVDADVLYVDDGSVITSAGTAAGLDACLHIVRRQFGSAAATAIARRMVVPPHRSGGQAQYIQRAVSDPDGSSDLAGALLWAVAHLHEPLDVGTLARRAHLSRRTLDRRFRDELGTSPLAWVLHQRVLEAQRLLESTDLTVDAVAGRAGFSSGMALRPHFRRVVGVSPQDYRRTFRRAVRTPSTAGGH